MSVAQGRDDDWQESGSRLQFGYGCGANTNSVFVGSDFCSTSRNDSVLRRALATESESCTRRLGATAALAVSMAEVAPAVKVDHKPEDASSDDAAAQDTLMQNSTRLLNSLQEEVRNPAKHRCPTSDNVLSTCTSH